MSEQKQNLSGDEIVDKASDLAQQNPDAARSVIDKVEDAVDTATGGRFSEAIDKAGDLLEDKLGLPNNQGGTDTAPPVPSPDPNTDPTPTPSPDPAPSPDGPSVPFPDDPGSPDTGAPDPSDPIPSPGTGLPGEDPLQVPAEEPAEVPAPQAPQPGQVPSSDGEMAPPREDGRE